MNKNDRWVARNFEKLIDLYGGRYVAVVNKRVVAVGPRPDKVEERARTLTGTDVPSVLMVPRKENLRGVFTLQLHGLS